MKKILILTANPKNSDKLRLDEEVREIQEGCSDFLMARLRHRAVEISIHRLANALGR